MTEYEKYVDELAMLIEKRANQLDRVIFRYETKINIGKTNKKVLADEIIKNLNEPKAREPRKFLDVNNRNYNKFITLELYFPKRLSNSIWINKKYNVQKKFSTQSIVKLLYNLDKDLSKELYEYLEEVIIRDS